MEVVPEFRRDSSVSKRKNLRTSIMAGEVEVEVGQGETSFGSFGTFLVCRPLGGCGVEGRVSFPCLETKRLFIYIHIHRPSPAAPNVVREVESPGFSLRSQRPAEVLVTRKANVLVGIQIVWDFLRLLRGSFSLVNLIITSHYLRLGRGW